MASIGNQYAATDANLHHQSCRSSKATASYTLHATAVLLCGGVCIPGNLVGCMETEFDCADRDWLGMDPLKEESADAVGTELGLPFASRGFFLVKDAHLFLTALSVLQADQITWCSGPFNAAIGTLSLNVFNYHVLVHGLNTAMFFQQLSN